MIQLFFCIFLCLKHCEFSLLIWSNSIILRWWFKIIRIYYVNVTDHLRITLYCSTQSRPRCTTCCEKCCVDLTCQYIKNYFRHFCRCCGVGCVNAIRGERPSAWVALQGHEIPLAVGTGRSIQLDADDLYRAVDGRHDGVCYAHVNPCVSGG